MTYCWCTDTVDFCVLVFESRNFMNSLTGSGCSFVDTLHKVLLLPLCWKQDQKSQFIFRHHGIGGTIQYGSSKTWLTSDIHRTMSQHKMADTGCLGIPKVSSDVICSVTIPGRMPLLFGFSMNMAVSWEALVPSWCFYQVICVHLPVDLCAYIHVACMPICSGPAPACVWPVCALCMSACLWQPAHWLQLR